MSDLRLLEFIFISVVFIAAMGLVGMGKPAGVTYDHPTRHEFETGVELRRLARIR